MLERISFFPNHVNRCLNTTRKHAEFRRSLVSGRRSTIFSHSGIDSSSIRKAINLCHTSEE
ncbi:unnamed protein product [Brassica oleracea var. botrytis]